MAKSFVVIGGGPGGEAAAKKAAGAGGKVTLVEKRDVGGLCLNRGCIPSKTLLEAGRLLNLLRRSDVHSGKEDVKVDWGLLQNKKTTLVSNLRNALMQNLTRLGVNVLRGEARFANDRTLTVRTEKGDERLPFDVAILAAGSNAFFPEPFASVRNAVLDSDKVLDLPRIPQSIMIVGGGAIGCEFACLFHEMGSQVYLVEKLQTLLPGEDPAIVRILQSSFEKRGIKIFAGSEIQRTARQNEGWKSELSTGQIIESQEILVCVGRRPDVENINVENAAIRQENGRVLVNEFLQTSNPRVYAVGDVNGLSLLAHAAAAQGEVAVEHALGGNRHYDNSLVPRCLYTWPEVASIGEWMSSAEAKGIHAQSRRFFFQGSAKALAASETDGFIQIVSEKDEKHRLLGAQIIGPHATELIHIFSVGLQAGVSIEQLRAVIFAHPTLSEGVKEALSR